MEQIIKFTHNEFEYLGVCVPEGATKFFVHPIMQILGWTNKDGSSDFINLDWVLHEPLFTLSQATEEQLIPLIGQVLTAPNKPNGYMWDIMGIEIFETAKMAVEYGIRSLGGDDTKEWVLLRKL